MLTILPDSMTSREFSAGVMGGAPERGNVATAFFGRIRFFALQRNLLPATLLGHVVAHEVGHLLLREGHARRAHASPMCGERTAASQVSRLGFNATQGRRIRSRLGVERDPPNLATQMHEAIVESTPPLR
jgi:hypothetical protein